MFSRKFSKPQIRLAEFTGNNPDSGSLSKPIKNINPPPARRINADSQL